MRLFLAVCLFLGLYLSCEDSKTPKTQPTTTVVVKDTIQAPKEVATPAEKGTPQNPFIASQAELKGFLKTYGEENPETKIRIETRFGNIDVTLFKDTPLHRANFLLLAKNEYFNTTQFHRVAAGFVVQGGNNDTETTARNRASMGKYLLPNESKTKYSHRRGAFSASKFIEQNISKASSPFEFFIVQSHTGSHHLDGEHTVFGRVTKGMEVVDQINALEVDGSEWPIENVYMKVIVLE